MKKPILYRLFRLGSVPRRLLSVLDQEGIVVIDEGICGSFIAINVNGPGKRYRGRSEMFYGFLVIKRRRVVCYTFRKRQINIYVNDDKIMNLYVDTPNEQELRLSFESSDFREGWRGVIEFRFDTEKAFLFREVLLAIGVQKGVAPERNSADAP